MSLVDRFSAWFSERPPREQRLLGVLGLIAIAMLGLVIALRVSDAFASVRDELDRAVLLADEVEIKKDEYAQKFGAQTEKRERDPVPRLASFLEDISNRRAVPVQNYGAEKTVPTKDKRYTETSMEVKLSKVTLEQAASFLEEIENASEAAYTKQLELNLPRKDQRDSFEVTINVTTYQDTKAEKKDDKDKKDDKKSTSKPTASKPEPVEPGASPEEPAQPEPATGEDSGVTGIPGAPVGRPIPGRPRPNAAGEAPGIPPRGIRAPVIPGKNGYTGSGLRNVPTPATTDDAKEP